MTHQSRRSLHYVRFGVVERLLAAVVDIDRVTRMLSSRTYASLEMLSYLRMERKRSVRLFSIALPTRDWMASNLC